MNRKTKNLLILLLFIAIPLAGIVLMPSDAPAFNFYSTNIGATGNCADCHGQFASKDNYTSPKGEQWATNLHDGHRDLMLSRDCDTCHGGTGTSGRQVHPGSSAGGTGFQPIACVGCHGRDEDAGNDSLSAGRGAGLRQHHENSGNPQVPPGTCSNCHSDADPANYMPVGEDVMPPYYFTPDAAHPDKPTDSCNPNGEENFHASALGLDNDGDNVYDTADPDCANVEICDDGVDNNGNGLTDCEDPACDGQTGPNGETCEQPTERTCNDGFDNDADGLFDCADPDCNGEIGPNGEICETPSELSCFDTFDNDADGATDCADGDCDGQTAGLNTCNTGLPGICAAGSRTCAGGAETCVQDNQAVEESIAAGNCNDGLDNDCDGLTDLQDPECQGAEDCFNGIDDNNNGLVDCQETSCFGVVDGACNTGEPGECSTGLLTCASDGTDTKTCEPDNLPVPELCDGLDNDCDGVNDNGFPVGDMCTVGVGACENTGMLVCTADGLGTECDAVPGQPQPEQCDGLDNDCDGVNDNGFNVGDPCTVGVGACENTGALVCMADGSDTECNVQPLPPGVEGPETDPTCTDLIDNDCDTLTDGADPDCGGAIIPPPVRQNIGFFDATISELNEALCRFCHEDPNIVDDANIPNRHHLRVGTPVQDPTVRPFPAGDTPDPNTGEPTYDCLSCHALVWDGSAFVLETFRDCIFCHGEGVSPHHTTAAALEKNCKACHGPITDPRREFEPDGPFLDGHQIPTTTPSLVTPTRSQGDGLPLNSRGNGAGACNYCHDSGLTEAGFLAGTNQEQHHNTSLFNQGFCTWCHDFGLPFEYQIRVCEECHGFESLHNIQADSNGDGEIIPNGEDPFWGHIGSNDDCWGCHGFAAASAPGTGAISPHIDLLSQYSVTAGADTALTLFGVALTNTVQTAEGPVAIDSQVVLTASDGTTTTLATTAISEWSMDVVVPASLTAGNYKLRAVKGSSDSNVVGVAIIPDVTITGVDCDKKKGVITINGSGFSSKTAGTDADINVEINGVVIDTVESWSDTQIRISVGSCSNNSTVTVNALFGSATSDGGNGGGNGGGKNKPPKPCKKNC